MKKTLILGANNNPERYAYKAAYMLQEYGHDFVPVGIKKGSVLGKDILPAFPEDQDIDTVTLYVNPGIQEQYYDDILKLAPKRIIFNPGTENEELARMAEENGIEALEACTLVLLRTGQF